jgi:hypothetical protein
VVHEWLRRARPGEDGVSAKDLGDVVSKIDATDAELFPPFPGLN